MIRREIVDVVDVTLVETGTVVVVWEASHTGSVTESAYWLTVAAA